MSQHRNRRAIGLISAFVVLPVLLIGYVGVMAISIPLGLVLNSGMGSSCLSSGSIAAAGSNSTTAGEKVQLPQATLDRLEQQDIRGRVEQNMERYTYAEKQTGVPWAVIASLHYREGGMRGDASVLNGQPILGYPYVNVDGQTVGANPKADAVNAANALKRLAKGVYDVDVTQDNLTLEDWGKAFLAYNRGYLYERAGASYELSPYVMNGLDEPHMDMSWSIADTVRGVDGNKAGALAVLSYIGGTELSGGVCGAGTVVSPVEADKLIVTSGAAVRTRASGKTKVHNGIDIIGGSQIVAVTSGTVVIAQNSQGGYGTAVKIDHRNGTFSLYAHLVEGSLRVEKGQNVIAGQALGVMGDTGDSEGVHLHFEYWEGGVPVNPFPFLADHGIELSWSKNAYPQNEKPGPLN